MVDLEKLKAEQDKLAGKVITHDMFDIKDIHTIAGVDQAYTSDGRIISAIVVLDFKTKKEIESTHAIKDIKFAYIPGFLSYREAPPIVEAYNMLKATPDIVMVDGNGILHPRRFGIASHLGILLDKITIGVAKNLLAGDTDENRVIIDKEVRGFRLMTKEHANPIFISPGHRIGLKTAVDISRNFIISPHKLPEPIHLAHKLANKIKKEIRISSGVSLDNGSSSSASEKEPESE